MDFSISTISCLSLETEAQSTAINKISGLCTVCNQIYSHFSSSPDRPYSHIHIGSWRHVFTKAPLCPGCRLIASVIASSSQINPFRAEDSVQIKTDFALPGSIMNSRAFYHNGRVGLLENVNFLEPLIDVILPFSGRTLSLPRVAGTIIRYEKSEMRYRSCNAKDPADDIFFRGRTVSATVDNDLLKDWIHRCKTRHNKCHLALDMPSRIRLIDVEERRIVVTSQEKLEYIALSYVWGKDTKGSLVKDTHDKLLSPYGITEDPSLVPQTILDTIQVVRNIGFRYLWVDSLCILQDDIHDQLRHLPHMDSIYRYASLVIVAAAGKDAHAGLPGVVHGRKRWQVNVDIGGVPFVNANPWVLKAVQESEWNTRGWTFQEAMLARRTLVFTERQVYWNCQESYWREDMTCEKTIAPAHMGETSSLWGKTMSKGTCPTKIYYEHVTRFSYRHFKKGGDVLWAFIGVLKLEASWFPKGFIWGMPYEILDTALLWSAPRCSCGENHIKTVHKRESWHSVHIKEGGLCKLRFPSWSWLSHVGAMDFLHTCEGSVISKVLWQEPLLIGNDAMPPTYVQIDCNINTKNSINQPKSVSFLGHMQNQGGIAMHYGFLRFMAQTVQLDIKWDVGDNRQIKDDNYLWVDAVVYNPHGERIGTICMVENSLKNRGTRLGECILLSANVKDVTEDGMCGRPVEGIIQLEEKERLVHFGNVRHVADCEHIENYNIMLVEWDGDIAQRLGLGTIERKAWETLETYYKQIILG